MPKVEIEESELQELRKAKNDAERRLADLQDDLKAVNGESKTRKLELREKDKQLEELTSKIEELKATQPEVEKLKDLASKYEQIQENERKSNIEKLNAYAQKLASVKDTDKTFDAANKLKSVIGDGKVEDLPIDEIKAKLLILETADQVTGIFGAQTTNQTVDVKHPTADDKAKTVTRSGVLYDPFNK